MSRAAARVPAMHRLLAEPAVAAHEAELGRETIKRAVEQVLDRVRASGQGDGYAAIVERIAIRLEEMRTQRLVPVINGTGIIVHTNLGRAPLAPEAIEAVVRLARGYSNLEYDLEAGERGSRYERARGLLREVTQAEDALVINNCAAAVLLVLDTFAKGREVIVARNQLVEIGGGFRVPEVLERSGATLVEVGTTNRVYIEDFERALSPRTALLLRTHPSNYRIEGFVHDVSASDLARLGRRNGVPVAEDLGSGALFDLAAYGVPHERTVQEALADGIDMVTFSGDKLLGGPQAGIVAGRAHLIARLCSNPLLRALRVDKMTLAALAATLHLYCDEAARERIPIHRMLMTPLAQLHRRAEAYLASLSDASVVESAAYAGGGAIPQERIESLAIAVATPRPDLLAASLRCGEPAIVGRVEEGRLLLDLRTIAPEEDKTVIGALTRWNRSPAR
jgi:L-seryl-tRNA(Ser) seleniumtransferase